MPETYQTYLTQLRADGLRIAARARQPGGLDADVPDCPGWALRDLVGHLGEIYQFVLVALTSDERPVKGRYPETPDAGTDLVDWFDSGHHSLVARLVDADPTDPAWTWWAPDQTTGFWARRMCHETLVHRMDADGALDFQADVTPELALDGVDEVLTRFVARPHLSSTRPTAGEVAVDVRSGGRTWRVAVDAAGVAVTSVTVTSVTVASVTVTSEPTGQPDATAEGSPVDVLRWSWGRPPRAPLYTTGDSAALDVVRAVILEAAG